jgi:membrane fusion protein, multidrug efflux system
MRKSSITYLLLILAVVALAIPKIFCNNEPAQSASGKSNKPINVTVYQVEPTVFSNKLQITGSLIAAQEVLLTSEIQGKVTAINFKEGSSVTQGQLLVQLNNKELLAQLKKANAQKTLKQLMFDRNQSLVKKGGISAEEFNLTETDLATINADIDLLNEQIAKTQIKAPFSGKIGLTNVSIGSVINQNTPIASLQQTDKLKLEFSVPEKYINKINIGDNVLFTAASSNQVLTASIYAVEPKVDEQTRNITVRAWHNNTLNLVAGGFVSVTLNLDNNQKAITVPTQCVVPFLKGQKVYVVMGDSIVEKKVSIGFRSDANVEITEGLNINDKVVVGGIMYMRAGAKVTVTQVINNK